MMLRHIALAFALAPGLAFAQAPSPDDVTSPPGDEVNEQRGPAPEVLPELGPDDEAARGEAPGPRGPAMMRDRRMGEGMRHHGEGMDHDRMMRMHHPEMARHMRGDDGHARISVRIGDRRLTISCGDTPIPECVEGATPLLELLR